jgi:hypothetical protein
MISEILGLSRDVLARVFPDKTQLELANAKLDELQQSGELKLLMSRNQIAVEEARSSDKWTSRARPLFMYVFYVLITFLVVIAPMLGVFYPSEMSLFYVNVKSGFDAIPTPMWATFTAGYLGYSGARTYEKVKHVTK